MDKIIQKINIEYYYNIGLKLLIFLPPFAILTHICDFANLPQGLFIQLFVLLLAVIFFLILTFNKDNQFKISPLFLPVILWITWASVTLLWTTSFYDSVLILMKWYSGFLIFILVFNSPKNIQLKLLHILFLSGLIVSLIGIAQFFFNFNFIPQVRPPSSTFGHKNVAIHFIMLTIPLGFSFIIISKDKKKNWLYQLSVSLMILYIFISYTRAGWIILFFQLLILAIIIYYDYLKKKLTSLWYPGKSIPLLVGIIISLIIMQCFSAKNLLPEAYNHLYFATKGIFKHRMFTHLEENKQEIDSKNEYSQNTKDTSFSGRLDVWINSLAIIKDYPFLGVGVGNYKVFFPRYQNLIVKSEWANTIYRVYNAHNDHIQVFVETGIIGGILWCFLLFRIFKFFTNLLKNSSNIENKYIITGIFLGIFGVLLNACFSFPFQLSIPPFIFLFYLGILSSFHTENENENENEKQKLIIINKNLSYGLSFCFIILFFILFIYSSRWIKADYHFMRILAAERMQLWPLVIDESKKAIKLNPYKREYYSFLGRAYIETKKPELAIDSIEKVLEVYPYHVNCLLNIGVAYSDMGKKNIAEQFFQKVISLLPDIKLAHKLLANIYIERKQYDNNLLNELNWILKFEPDNINLLNHMALAYINISNVSKAADIYKTIIALNQNHIGSYIQLIKIYFNQKNYTESENYYNTLKKLNIIKNGLTFFEIGRIALEMNKSMDAEYFFENAVKNDLKYIDLLFDLAKNYKENGNIEKAEIAYQILIKIQPVHSGAHNNLGNIYQMKNMTKKALNEYIIAANYQSDNHIFHFNIGYMAIKLNNYDLAEKAFKRVIVLKPDWADAYKNLGLLMIKLKRNKEAIVYFQKALFLNPMLEDHKIIKEYLTKYSILQTLPE